VKALYELKKEEISRLYTFTLAASYLLKLIS